jgi:hypothetical protein
MNTVQIGMRDTAVKTILKSCDKPYINTTVTANGLQEQWVWHNAIYFYFDNHFLTAVQYPTIPGLKPRQ